MRTYASTTVRHSPTRKRLAFFVLLLMVCGGAIIAVA